MFYKLCKVWSYATYCVVEADSVDEAISLSQEAEWDTDDGGEHYLEDKFILESETEDEVDNGERIEWEF